MKRPAASLLLPWILPALAAAGGCAGAGVSPPAAAGAPGSAGGSGAARAAVPPAAVAAGTEDRGDEGGIRRALAAALDGEAGWTDLRMMMGCLTADGFRTLVLYGDGVGIWNSASQFHLSPGAVRDLLAAFRRYGFATMRLSYGGKGDPAPAGGGAAAAVEVICRVELELGGARKAVAQLLGGRQSPELRALADELFAGCREAAGTGARAASLADGLAKLAAGELAPQALEVLLNVQAAAADAAGRHGWLLHLDGGEARVRPYDADLGLGEERGLALPAGELAALAAGLAADRLEEMPANLWAEDYTDVMVRVLDHKAEIAARQFAQMGPATHGEAQVRFDGAVARLRALAAEVEARGEPLGG